jgi:hypothetical protein
MLGMVASASGGLIVLTALPATSACAPPQMNVAPTKVAPSQSITVSGSHFVCSTATAPGGEAALTHIELRFVQGSVKTPLGLVDTGMPTFSITVKIPSSARAGAARIEAVATGIDMFQPIRVLGATTGLARTGTDAVGVWLWASILLTLGFLGRAIDGIWA